MIVKKVNFWSGRSQCPNIKLTTTGFYSNIFSTSFGIGLFCGCWIPHKIYSNKCQNKENQKSPAKHNPLNK